MLLCSSGAIADNPKKLETLRNRINALQMDLTAHEKTKQNAADALQDTERSISNINRKLLELKKNKQRLDDELKVLNFKYHGLKDSLEKERDQLNALLFQQYLGNEQNYLRALLNQQNPNQTTRDMYYYRQLSKSRTENINSLRYNLNQLQTLTQSVRKKKEKMITLQTEYMHQNEKLAQEKLKHKTILAQVSTEIAQQQNEISKLQQDENRIAKLVEEINKLLKQKDNKDALYNTRIPDATNQNVAFNTLKGKLNLPVRGKLVNRFGGQRSGRHIKWKGLFISSPGGSDVKAIAKGRVVFADWLRGFGNLLIIDHSHDYMSLYGNNEALLKQVGDIVRSGDTVATVGNSGGNPDFGLYFELRHKGKAFDPLTWVKIE
ncbi:MAG: non-catalytic member of peptidase subfamily M23B [Nitrosomonas sp.]|nr:MAG: non-catalytic member of peptidase subfamily M23B [Nitrosomonas sp.]